MSLRIETRKEGKDLFLIVNGEVQAELDAALFRKVEWPQACDSQEEWKEVFEETLFRAARNYALQQLSLRDHNTQMLRKKLREKKVPSNAAEQALLYCQEAGYLSDENWTDGYVRQLRRKGYGPSAVRQRLHHKGIAKELIEEVLRETGREDQEDSIRTLLESKYRNRDLNDPKERRRVMASLARRGFSMEAILTHLR